MYLTTCLLLTYGLFNSRHQLNRFPFFLDSLSPRELSLSSLVLVAFSLYTMSQHYPKPTRTSAGRLSMRSSKKRPKKQKKTKNALEWRASISSKLRWHVRLISSISQNLPASRPVANLKTPHNSLLFWKR